MELQPISRVFKNAWFNTFYNLLPNPPRFSFKYLVLYDVDVSVLKFRIKKSEDAFDDVPLSRKTMTSEDAFDAIYSPFWRISPKKVVV